MIAPRNMPRLLRLRTLRPVMPVTKINIANNPHILIPQLYFFYTLHKYNILYNELILGDCLNTNQSTNRKYLWVMFIFHQVVL